MDLLADIPLKYGLGAIEITLYYRQPSDPLYNTTNSKYFSNEGAEFGDLVGASEFSMILAGGDSGYVARSGFRTMSIDLEEIPIGAPMCLAIKLVCASDLCYYFSVPEPVRAAALVDNLCYVYTPGSREIPFDRSYARDYSSLVFDSASGIYTALSKWYRSKVQ